MWMLSSIYLSTSLLFVPVVIGCAGDGECPDCGKWFEDEPSRCRNQKYVNWCSITAPKVCGNGLVSPRKNERPDDPVRRPSNRLDRTTARPISQQAGNPEQIVKDCARNQRAFKPRCQKYATLDVNPAKLICEDPDCVDELPPILYCAANGQNRVSCCQGLGVDKDCLHFCDGSQQISISKTFKPLSNALKLQKCAGDDERRNIISCFKNNHEEQDLTTAKRWERYTLSKGVKNAASNRCGKAGLS